MSETAPEGNYVYQPIGHLYPVDYSLHPNPPIYAVAGPDVPLDKKEWYGITLDEAEAIVKKLNTPSN